MASPLGTTLIAKREKERRSDSSATHVSVCSVCGCEWVLGVRDCGGPVGVQGGEEARLPRRRGGELSGHTPPPLHVPRRERVSRKLYERRKR